MVSVRKQMFYSYFLVGILFIIVGISNYFEKNIFFGIISIVSSSLIDIYLILYGLKIGKKKYQQDDELSIENKNIAGYSMYSLIYMLAVFSIAIMSTVYLFTHKTISFSITLDKNSLWIICGIIQIVYYLKFIRLEMKN